jgi:hypothetical protein
MLSMRIRLVLVTLMIFAVTVTGTHAAETLGTGFTYQGELKTLGEPLNGSVDLEVALFDVEIDGVSLDVLELQNIPVTNGLFTIQLDFGAEIFNGDARWLEIAVRSPHDPTDTEILTTLTPRQPLTANPYALQTRGLFVDNSGNVGMGTDSPSPETTLHLRAGGDNFGVLVDSLGASGSEIGLHAGPSGYSSIAKNAFFNSGWKRFTETQGAFFQQIEPGGNVLLGVAPPGTGNIEWNTSLFLRSDGNVGVGHGNPVFPLHVKKVHASSWIAGIHNTGTGISDKGLVVRADGGDPFLVQSASGDLVSVKQNGNVGIGIITPASPLHVSSSLDLAKLLYVESKTTSDEFVVAITGEIHGLKGVGVFGVSRATSGVSTGVLGRVSSPDGYAGNFTGGRNYFEGNVGIGDFNPLAKLHIHAEGGTAPLLIEPGSTSEHMQLVPRATAPTGATEGDVYAHTNGTIYYRSNSAWTAMNSAADFSELMLPVGSGIKAHDGTAAYEGEIGFSEIISINDNGHYVRCRSPYDERISGIESGDRGLYYLPQGSPERTQGQRQFGLIGHVKLKVSAENGAIRPGDFVTCSGSRPGVGMKATRTGRVVGIAKGAFDGDHEKVGLIEVYVNPHTWLADSTTVSGAAGNDYDALKREFVVLKAENASLRERLDDIENLIHQLSARDDLPHELWFQDSLPTAVNNEYQE